MRKRAALLLFAFTCSIMAARGAAGPPLRVCLVSGSEEYKSDVSLAAFQKHLEQRYNAQCTFITARNNSDLPGLDALENCDVALFFTRRLTTGGDPLERVKKYCTSGRPIVAVRTACHGFQNWLEFDKLVLGGSYTGHFGAGTTAKMAIEPGGKNHPVLDGVVPIRSRSSLYKCGPAAPDCTVLLTGSTPLSSGSQPVAWTRVSNGGRVFFTSLGAPEDFENATFQRMIANALFWTAKRDVERKELDAPPQRPKPDGALHLILRTRMEAAKGSGIWEEKTIERTVPVAETAILICDMWDAHWCRGASERCAALAKKMAPVVNAARARGVQIIHCPSDTLYFYTDQPQRRRMTLAPAVAPPKPLDLPNPPLPIDDSDGGCDTGEKPGYPAWTRQSPLLDIGEYDGIADSGAEVYNFMAQQGIKNLILMGVHTNMCVLGRTFAIRQMTKWGVPCVLVRDLTDAMYDPKDRPYVTHEEGTELVVQYIEKYWCPTTLSAEFTAGLPK